MPPPRDRGESIATSVGSGVANDRFSAERRAPKSYRRLVEGISAAEEATSEHKREALETSFEIAALRDMYRKTVAESDAIRHEEAQCRAAIDSSRLECAAIWNAYEQPLQDQEEAVQTAARLAAALELREEYRSAVNTSLNLECEELRHLGETLRAETQEHEQSHIIFTEHFERSESSAQTLVARCNDWDQRVEVLQSKVTSERDRAGLMSAEIEAARKQMEATKSHLSDMERRCQGSVASWWQEHGSHCHALAEESDHLQKELEIGKHEMEYQVEESAQWRDQAYRSEAGLLQLRRGDVASGIRSIADQCNAYANAGTLTLRSSNHPV